MPTPEPRTPIALLSQVGEASRHLRDALAGAGTPIVYEAHAAQLDRDALEQSGARVVVVNLDVDVDAQLDEGVRESWITADERKQLEELRAITLDAIMVDDFDPEELRSAGYASLHGRIAAARAAA